SLIAKHLKASVRSARNPSRLTVAPNLSHYSNDVADDDFIAFFCGHIFHKECLLDPEAVEAVNASRVRGLKQGGVANKITEAALLKPYLAKGCEICGIIGSEKTLDKGKGKGVGVEWIGV